MNIDPHDRTAGFCGDAQGRAACPTGNIEQDLSRRKVEPAQKPVLLICREPTVLPNILPESLATNLRVELCIKISVVSVVVNGGLIGFQLSC